MGLPPADHFMEIFVKNKTHGAGATLKTIVDEIIERNCPIFYSYPLIVAVVRFDSNHSTIFHVGLNHTGTGTPAITDAGCVYSLI